VTGPTKNLAKTVAWGALLIGTATTVSKCAPQGESSTDGVSLKDVSGSIKSSTGRQTDMAGWTIMTLERSTQIARSALIGDDGTYSLGNIRADRPRTIALLSPDHLLRSILSIPTSSATQINQYFSATPDRFPPLFERGPIVVFGELEGIDAVDDAIASDRGNGVPNAAYGDNGYGLVAGSNPGGVDLTGLPAVFNPDRNANGTLDIFETDVNNNTRPDTSENYGPNFFSEGLAHAAVQYELSSATNGSETAQVVFSARLQSGATATDIKVNGSSNLTSGATVSGGSAPGAWDGTLLDDGTNEDGVSGDGIFARRVTLGSATRLKSYEVILFEPRRADAGANPAGQPIAGAKYPVTAPPVTLTAMSTPVWDSVTRTINRVGNPFGSVTAYTWSVTVFDANGKPVYSSASIAGTEDSFVIPDNATSSGGSYTAKVTAKCQEQVSGYSFFVVTSPAVSL
jgi:hypothetical protein